MPDCEAQLQQKIRAYQEGSASLEEARDLAGDIGDQECISATHILLQMLKHEDEIVRYYAVMSLGFKLRIKGATSELIGTFQNDSDVDCRCAAAGALSSMWRNTKDRQLIESFAKAALDDEDEDVRKAAYSALITVSGLPDDKYLRLITRDPQAVDPIHVAAILACLPA